MSNKYSSKREQFVKPQKSKMPIIAGGIAVILLASVLFFVFTSNKTEEGSYFGAPIAEPRSYIGNLISMTTVEPVIEDGQIAISLNEVDENNIVYFEIENNINQMVPLMAYITPTGRLFVGSSMCEPCRGRTFSLAGETLVCDTCRTTYTIEDHKFLSGSKACGSYPPVNMNPRVEDGIIYINLDDVLNWRIRS